VGIPKAGFGFYNRFPRDTTGYSVHTSLGPRTDDIRLPIPWSDLYGLARSLLAAGPLLTLLFTSAPDLIFVVDAENSGNRCSGLIGWGLFRLGGNDHLQVKQWIAIVLLVGVVSGWRPRVTCLPHAYVAISCLLDRRRWHWSSYNPPDLMTTMWGQVRIIGAFLGMTLIKVQVSWLYLQSGISKLGQTVWLDGTAMYYWTRNGTFGAPTWSRDIVYRLTAQPIFGAGMTWGPIVIEIAEGISLFLHYRLRLAILCAGITLHLFIGLIIGLWSFSIVMWGCLLFLLIPFGQLAHASSRELQQREVAEVKPILTTERAASHGDQPLPIEGAVSNFGEK
jgi:hypothetical protein